VTKLIEKEIKRRDKYNRAIKVQGDKYIYRGAKRGGGSEVKFCILQEGEKISFSEGEGEIYGLRTNI
jgi:hypothetical protein